MHSGLTNLSLRTEYELAAARMGSQAPATDFFYAGCK